MNHPFDEAFKEITEICKKHEIEIIGEYGYWLEITSKTHVANIDGFDGKTGDYMYYDKETKKWIDTESPLDE